ncbi:L,D-transpeptidase [Amycolatopsis alkalitolerans]|uniref:L,D-transpeptidase n=1 Tax=Amycolatopsis alkalitolerans TaxID=2547244 RepID=A0A5C4LSH2_9PSEU|nr:L,D-transpeptidase [Amycolatopsis alkalitolerans]TNC20868.1 L,D-transpeptidase [Amycolatopsis alkalitolerans]
MRVKKISLALTAAAAAVVVAGCAGGTKTAAVQPAVASAPTSSSPAAPTTTTTKAPPPSTSTTTAPPSTSTAPRTTAPKTTVKPAANPSVPCSITDGACVDISAKKAWLLSGGKIVYGPVPVTTGRRGHATPTGTFHVLYKQRMHYSKEFDNAPMPYSVFFYPGDAFHTGSLSVPSHGCVHLSSSASQKFFATLSVGDPVQVVP